MKIETKTRLVLSHKEHQQLLECHTLLCDISNNSMTNHIVNNDILPCGFCVEDLRDGIGFIIETVDIE